MQDYYSLTRRDDDAEVVPVCLEFAVGYIPYFPLDSGLSTGKYRRGEAPPEGTRLAESSDRLTDERLRRVEELEAFAAGHGRTLLELAGRRARVDPRGRVRDRRGDEPRAGACQRRRGRRWELTGPELAELESL